MRSPSFPYPQSYPGCLVFFTLFSSTCPILHLPIPILLLRYFQRSWTFQRKLFDRVNKKFEIFGHRNCGNLLYAQALSLNIISPTPASHEEVKYLFPVILFTFEHSVFIQVYKGRIFTLWYYQLWSPTLVWSICLTFQERSLCNMLNGKLVLMTYIKLWVTLSLITDS